MTHPAIVHLPIAFALFAAPLGLGLLLLCRRHPDLRRLWLVLVFWHLAQSAAIYAAMFTGENAQERPGLSERATAIESHEERAELFFYISLAAIPLAAWGVKKTGTPRLLLIGLEFCLLGLCVYTAWLGGQIFHEAQAEATGAAAPPPITVR